MSKFGPDWFVKGGPKPPENPPYDEPEDEESEGDAEGGLRKLDPGKYKCPVCGNNDLEADADGDVECGDCHHWAGEDDFLAENQGDEVDFEVDDCDADIESVDEA